MNDFFISLWNQINGTIFHTSFFPVILSIFCYYIAKLLNKKFPYAIVNPLLIGSGLTVAILLLLKMTYADYKTGGDLLSMWLAPATEILALNIYSKRKIIKENIFPIIAASLAGAFTCVLCVWGLGKIFGLDKQIVNSLLPKSVTTPIALSLSSSLSGIQAVTMTGVMTAGIFGGMFAGELVKIFHIKNPLAAGLAIGCSSHAVGTSSALKIGETEGALSSIGIGTMGLATTFVFIFIK